MKNKFLMLWLVLVTLVVSASNSMATAATPPVDLTTIASNLVDYVGAAAILGATVFGAIYGVRILIKAFRAIAK